MEVLSFNAATKKRFVARAKAHQLADEIVKGQYWQDGKGCAVGCLVHSSSHEKLAEEMGIPLGMAHLIQVGEPISCGMRHTRFHLGLVDRHRPSRMYRLEGEGLTAFLAAEKVRLDKQKRQDEYQRQYDALWARQEVKDADGVRCLIEADIAAVVDRLTPQEWADLSNRLS